VLVKAWDPSDWTLSQPFEIFVPKSATLTTLATLISEMTP